MIMEPDSHFLLSRCRLDRLFHLPLLGCFYAWGLVSVGFRFIMIKYSERGLVEKGIIRTLMNNLYYLTNLFFWSIGLTVDFGKYITKGLEAENQMKYLKRCSKTLPEKAGSHILLVNFFLFVCALIIPVSILTLGVKHFINRTMLAGSKKFGKYQRNLITFNQTVMAFLCSLCLEIIMLGSLNIMESVSMPRLSYFQSFFSILT